MHHLPLYVVSRLTEVSNLRTAERPKQDEVQSPGCSSVPPHHVCFHRLFPALQNISLNITESLLYSHKSFFLMLTLFDASAELSPHLCYCGLMSHQITQTENPDVSVTAALNFHYLLRRYGDCCWRRKSKDYHHRKR